MTDWRRFLDAYVPSTTLKHEVVALRVCHLAVQAADRGTYGVGAVLLGEDGHVMHEGHNEVYIGAFRSDLHAEMVVINRFEADGTKHEKVRGYTLVTSLEPCPMCMTRLIFAGVGSILYLSPDRIGGMVQRKTALPPIFQQITEDQRQVWGQAECSEVLRSAAFHIWDQSRVELDRALPGRKDRARND